MKQKKILTQSEIATFKACPQKHWWRYRLLWVPYLVAASTLEGAGDHKGLEFLYKGLPYDVCELAIREIFDNYLLKHQEAISKPDDYREARERCVKVFQNYISYWWGKDNRTAHHPDTGEPLIETEFQIPIYSPSGRASRLFMLRGKWDRLVIIDGEVWIEENKTRAEISETSGDRLVLDQQARIYCYAAMIYLGIPVRGVYYNLLRRKDAGRPGINKDGTVSVQRVDTTLDVYMDTLHRQDAYLKSLTEEDRKARKQAKGLTWEKYEKEIERIKNIKWFDRFYQPYDEIDYREVQNDLYQISLQMHQCKYPYKNDGACDHWGGCQYRPVCQDRDPEPYFRVASKKHSELYATHFHAPLGEPYRLLGQERKAKIIGTRGLLEAVCSQPL